MRKTLGTCNLWFCSVRLQLQISSNRFCQHHWIQLFQLWETDCWLEIFQVWRQGQIRPCSGEAVNCSVHPSPGAYPRPSSHWHVEDNVPYPTSEASYPAPKWPPDQKSHLGKGPRKAKGYLTWNARQACVLILLPPGIFVSWTLLEPRVLVMFFLLYISSIFLFLFLLIPSYQDFA